MRLDLQIVSLLWHIAFGRRAFSHLERNSRFTLAQPCCNSSAKEDSGKTNLQKQWQ